ncbi:MAG: Cell division coordinator CpoB [Syntrophus sp. SKADARSKE-3]|nr:Cell division coordinator CpoB [Syntrophus sp. SKADARSKE-3]
MNIKILTFVFIASLIGWWTLTPSGWCQTTTSLETAIKLYQQENYEEAIDILTKVREQDKSSSAAAFFLGLAYKQTNDIQSALKQFQDAVNLRPAIKEATLELADVLFQIEKYDEAMKWVVTAEKIGVAPAKAAFLKGMILSKQGRYDDAIAMFEKSKKLETSYTQAADFQIGIALMSGRKFGKAKDRFQAAITQDPQSDLASFARRYQDIVEEQSFLQRPLRIVASVMGQYDTNMLAEPKTFSGLPDSGKEQSLALTSGLRLDYIPTLSGPWLFNAGYAASSRVNENNSTRYDVLSNTFSAAAGLGFSRFAFNLSGNYTYVLKRGDYENNGGGYRRYSENFTVGPLLRFLANQNHIIEAYAGYAKKNYFKTAPVGNPGDDMTACGIDSYLSWMWLLQNGGLINTRIGFSIDNADGFHYDNNSYKFSINAIYPIWQKLNLQLGGEINFAPYKNNNEFFNNTARDDKIYTGTIGFNWNFNRYTTAIIQYTGTIANSNIMLYDYTRSLWSIGLELRF